MEEKLDAMSTLERCIADYSTNFSTYDLSKIQEIRDKMTLSLHYLVDVYATLKYEADSAEYHRKKCFAESCESLRKSKDEVTGKGLTREQITDRAYILSSEKTEAQQMAERDFFRMKHIFETSNQILNAISSRINLKR